MSLSQQEMLRILNERAKKFRHEESSEAEATEEMIVFVQSSTQYAIPLNMLTEIRWVSQITRLAMVSKHILGVINVRGRIVAVYGLADSEDEKDSCFVLVGHGVAGHVAIAAEDIVGTIAVSKSDIRTSPISLNGKDYIAGVGRDGMIYLDLEKLVNNKKLYMA